MATHQLLVEVDQVLATVCRVFRFDTVAAPAPPIRPVFGGVSKVVGRVFPSGTNCI